MSQEYCSILTQKLHVDGCGTAPPNISYFLLVETPKPWPQNEKSVPTYPNYAFDLAKGNLKIHLLSPGSYSKEGLRKILFFKVSPDNMSFFKRAEYHIPEERTNELIQALFTDENNEKLSKFDQYLDKSENIRDLFICGHFAKDYCCGTFGNELYEKTLKFLSDNSDQAKNIRVWQTSHIKGHKFAPTMIDFPEGRFWAHLNEDILFKKIIPIEGITELTDLKMHIRGLASTSNFGQLAERELFLQNGPGWRKMKKTIKVANDPENKNKAQVEITYETSEGLKTEKATVTFIPETITVSDHACGEPSTFKNATVNLEK